VESLLATLARRGTQGRVPKLVNYSARFEFLREAAFTVVRDRGVSALSRHSVAAVLGTSVNTVRRLLSPEADLRVLAADEVARRRLHGRLGRLRDGETVERAGHVVRALLPDAQHRVDEEVVWLRLMVALPRDGSAQADADGPLRDRWQLAEHGYVLQGDVGHGADGGAEGATRPGEPGEHPLAEHLRTREGEIASRLGEALRLLEVPPETRADETVTLRALTDGLTQAVCASRLTPEEAVAHLEHHLRHLAERVLRPTKVNE
jgi:hypothetical protein